MTWLFAYLLVGFVLYWVGTDVFKIEYGATWKTNLAAILCWPVAIIVGACVRRTPRKS